MLFRPLCTFPDLFPTAGPGVWIEAFREQSIGLDSKGDVLARLHICSVIVQRG